MSQRRNPTPRHVCVRLRPEMVARVDVLAACPKATGDLRDRSAVLSAAIRAGLPIIEARQNKKGFKPKKASLTE